MSYATAHLESALEAITQLHATNAGDTSEESFVAIATFGVLLALDALEEQSVASWLGVSMAHEGKRHDAAPSMQLDVGPSPRGREECPELWPGSARRDRRRTASSPRGRRIGPVATGAEPTRTDGTF